VETSTGATMNNAGTSTTATINARNRHGFITSPRCRPVYPGGI
jgi:hypothetical protein